MDHQSLEAKLADLQARLVSLERQKRRRWGALAIVASLATAAAVAAPVTMVQFTPNTPAVAAQINQNFDNLNTRIEEVNTTLQTSIAARTPQGTIAFFATACPAGWTPYVAAAGRFVVATPAGGTVTTAPGTALTNGEDRVHSHMWVEMVSVTGGQWDWRTWNAAGTATTMIRWDNGMDGVGADVYPLGMDDATPQAVQHFTRGESSRLPYIQLNACIRGT